MVQSVDPGGPFPQPSELATQVTAQPPRLGESRANKLTSLVGESLPQSPRTCVTQSYACQAHGPLISRKLSEVSSDVRQAASSKQIKLAYAI